MMTTMTAMIRKSACTHPKKEDFYFFILSLQTIKRFIIKHVMFRVTKWVRDKIRETKIKRRVPIVHITPPKLPSPVGLVCLEKNNGDRDDDFETVCNLLRRDCDAQAEHMEILRSENAQLNKEIIEVTAANLELHQENARLQLLVKGLTGSCSEDVKNNASVLKSVISHC